MSDFDPESNYTVNIHVHCNKTVYSQSCLSYGHLRLPGICFPYEWPVYHVNRCESLRIDVAFFSARFIFKFQ